MTENPQQNEPKKRPLNVIVTGAAGFLGRRLVAHLIKKDAEVWGIDRIPCPDDWDVRVPYQQSEIGEGQSVSPFPQSPGEFVWVHLAWNMNRADSKAQQQSRSDFEYLLKAFTGSGCCGVVGLGSAEEYGNLEGCLSEEMAPGAKLSAYGQAKHEACRAVEAWACESSRRAIWLRPFIVYGPGQTGSMVIPTAVRCAQERQSADFSAGLQNRDFIHVEDVAEGIAQAALRVAGDGEPFSLCNLGGGRPVQVRAVLERIAEQLNAKDLFHLGARPMRVGEPKEQFASVVAADRVLGWQAQIPWEEGIDALCKETPR